MTFFFSLEKLKDDNTSIFLKRIRNYYNKRVLLNSGSKDWLAGNSFLLNPEPVINGKNLDPIYVVQYIKLAAKRDYLIYKHYNNARLDISFYPDLNIQNISSNPLININNQELSFLYEERIKGNKLNGKEF